MKIKMRIFLIVLLAVCGLVAVGSVFMAIGAMLGTTGAWKIAVFAVAAAGLMLIGFCGAEQEKKKKANANTNANANANTNTNTNANANR